MFDSCLFDEILFDGTRLVGGMAHRKDISEALWCIDYSLKHPSRCHSEIVNTNDIIDRLLEVKRLMTEYVGAVDCSYLHSTKSATDQLCAIDYSYLYNFKNITDITALSDTKLSSVCIPKLDTIFIYDDFKRILELFRLCTDVSYLSDFSIRQPSLLKSDSALLSDYSIRSAFEVIMDDIDVLDIFTRTMSTYRTFDDMAELLDIYTWSPTKQITNVIYLYDTAKASLLRVIYDVINVADSIIRNVLYNIDDDVFIADSIFKYLSYIRNDAVVAEDGVFKDATIPKRDVTSMLDLVYKTPGIIVYDMCGVVDSILYTTNPVVISNIIKKVIHLGDIGGLW